MSKPNPEREWKKTLDAHASSLVAEVLAWDHQVRGVNPGPMLGGSPTIEIQGPDGEWRRYYVRLTEAAAHEPIDPAHMGVMRA